MILDDEKPMTHTVWTPFFDYYTGEFRRWVEVGEAAFEMDSNARSIAKMQLDRRVIGYDSGYHLSLPQGEQPQESPPQEVIDAALADAEQRNQGDLAVTAH
jgi:hypothetical protein